MAKDNPEEGLGANDVGRLRYKKGDYAGALKAFSEAINFSTGPLLLTALDHRAGTYEKLNQLQNALRDAKTMIDLRPDGAKGYMRCSKILQLRGDNELASMIYERGLMKVKLGTDPDRLKLEELSLKLKARQAPKVDLNPFKYLPAELAQMVCVQLSVADRVSCLRVHSTWRAFLEAQPKLWMELDTTGVKIPLTTKALKSHLKRSKFGVTKAIIRLTVTKFDTPKLRYLVMTCKNLIHLHLQQGIIGNSLLEVIPMANRLQVLVLAGDTMVTQNCVTMCLIKRPNLIAAEFHNVDPGEWTYRSHWTMMDKLETLVLNAPKGNNNAWESLNLQDLIRCTPNMKRLELKRWTPHGRLQIASPDFRKWSHLETLSLAGTRIKELPTLPDTLKQLDVSEMWYLEGYGTDSDTLLRTPPSLPHLRKFNCANTTFFSKDAQHIFGLATPSLEVNCLEELDLGYVLATRLSPDVFKESSNLSTLSLAGWQGSEDNILVVLAMYPNLNVVDLSQTMTTGVTVRMLADRKHRPQRLVLKQCRYISLDAVEYARAASLATNRTRMFVEYSQYPRAELRPFRS